MGKPQDDDFLPRDATREEIDNLVHEPDKVPITAWLLPFTGAMAQLARYGVTVTWRKFRQLHRSTEWLMSAIINRELPAKSSRECAAPRRPWTGTVYGHNNPECLLVVSIHNTFVLCIRIRWISWSV